MSKDTTKTAVLVGYDGSPSAAGAIEIGARLFPGATAHVAHIWSPPFTSRALHARLLRRAATLGDLIAGVEREGAAEAERLAADGVALAAAAGWQPTPLVHRCYGDEGFELARLAERLRPDAVVVGSRGLSGARAVLGSVSDAAVHYSPTPVLVVPQPLLTEERNAASDGPVLVGYDGSAGAERALSTAAALFAARRVTVVTVGADAPAEGELAGIADLAVETVRVEPRGMLESGRAVADALAACAADRGAAVIVVGSRGRSARREILLGSVAMAVLHHAHRPVFVVPDPDRFRTA